jgi:hypothetical protein
MPRVPGLLTDRPIGFISSIAIGPVAGGSEDTLLVFASAHPQLSMPLVKTKHTGWTNAKAGSDPSAYSTPRVPLTGGRISGLFMDTQPRTITITTPASARVLRLIPSPPYTPSPLPPPLNKGAAVEGAAVGPLVDGSAAVHLPAHGLRRRLQHTHDPQRRLEQLPTARSVNREEMVVVSVVVIMMRAVSVGPESVLLVVVSFTPGLVRHAALTMQCKDPKLRSFRHLGVRPPLTPIRFPRPLGRPQVPGLGTWRHLHPVVHLLLPRHRHLPLLPREMVVEEYLCAHDLAGGDLLGHADPSHLPNQPQVSRKGGGGGREEGVIRTEVSDQCRGGKETSDGDLDAALHDDSHADNQADPGAAGWCRWGVSDLLFSLGDNALASFVVSVQFLPTVKMYIQLCPEGAEGTAYAMLTTFSNVAMAVGSNIGTLMSDIWDVSNAAIVRGECAGEGGAQVVCSHGTG